METRSGSTDMIVTTGAPGCQSLHLVFGGELADLSGSVRFRDTSSLHVVGIFPNYAAAYDAWKSAAQKSVDSAHTRYFIVDMQKLLSPRQD